jgi:hypothetical protein
MQVQDYLARLGTPPYNLEAGYTPEAELSHLLCHLHETEGEMLDDGQSGSAAYCPDAWFPSDGYVPGVDFNRGYGRLLVVRGYPDSTRPRVGVRSSVRAS